MVTEKAVSRSLPHVIKANHLLELSDPRRLHTASLADNNVKKKNMARTLLSNFCAEITTQEKVGSHDVSCWRTLGWCFNRCALYQVVHACFWGGFFLLFFFLRIRLLICACNIYVAQYVQKHIQEAWNLRIYVQINGEPIHSYIPLFKIP